MKMLQQLSNSLKKRGFWVEMEGNELVLDKDFIIIEFYTLLEVLNHVHIEFSKGEKGIVINETTITDQTLEMIASLPRRTPIALLANEKTFEPVGYYNGSYNLSVLELERSVASFIFALNKVGFYTASSQFIDYPVISSYYLDHVDTVALTLGRAKEFVHLNYEWYAFTTEKQYFITIKEAEKVEEEKVQEDAYTLAKFFLQVFPAIPETDFEQWG